MREGCVQETIFEDLWREELVGEGVGGRCRGKERGKSFCAFSLGGNVCPAGMAREC